ncbi:MAG: ABC transporter substrate-binding protein [Alphaproteobacteria bacterium]|nr:ABC transporter substrate-binding protein [Alphaproteobacteria bacterium]
MLLRPFALRLATALLLLGFVAVPVGAADFTDSAQRRVVLPDRIGRVMAANPSAEVLVFALAPDKLAGWTRPLGSMQRPYVPARFANLPVTGRITGPNPTATIDTVRRLRPDLVIDAGMLTPERIALADAIQQQTGVPCILVDDSIQRTPTILRAIGVVLGVADRGNDLATFAEHAIVGLRGRLLIRPADDRPRVYYGRRPDGLETALPGSPAGEDINEAGAINVAAGLGRDARILVSRDQLRGWDPNVIIAEDRSFYDALLRDPLWRNLDAVRYKRIYLAPANPFGWIDDPPGINRLIGLYWLSSVLYPDMSQEDLRSTVRDFYDKFYGMKLTDAQIEGLLRLAEARVGETRRPTGGEPLVGLGAAPPVPIPTGPTYPTATPPGRGGPTPGGTVPNVPPTRLH